jgi:type IV pilus assembly protein PilQ
MKNTFKFSGFIFLSCLLFSVLPKGALADSSSFLDMPAQISLDFKDAGLKDVLKIFSIQSGLNFIASEAVQDRKITLYLDKVPIDKAMERLFEANNLTYQLDSKANIFIVKDWGKPQVETVTKVFYLKYATVSSSPLRKEIKDNLDSDSSGSSSVNSGSGSSGLLGGSSSQEQRESGITEVVKKLLSDKGSLTEDPRTNSLIVTDIPSRMPAVIQTIADLDVAVPQVMLEVEMLDVSKNTVDKMGLKFGQTPLTMVLTGSKIANNFPFWDSDRSGSTKTITSGSVDFSTATYQVLIDFLRTQTDTKSLARPKILTLNNETAEIKIVTQEAISLSTTQSAAGSLAEQTTNEAERAETGVSLRVTPQINVQAGEITMFVMPMVKDTSISTISASIKDPEERSTKSTVRMKDGETVIIGGLIRNDISETITKLPVLGDIPILGALFRHKNKDKNRERELLVFITPHIVQETDKGLPQARNISLPIGSEAGLSTGRTGLLEREQNSPVLPDERRTAINSSLNTSEEKKK